MPSYMEQFITYSILPGECSETEWLEIAKGFEDKWNFPHCIGAIDGKHIIIEVK